MANIEKPKEEDFFAEALKEEAARKESKPVEEFFPVEKSKPITEEDIWGLEAGKKKEAKKEETRQRLEAVKKEMEDIFAGKEESEVASANEIEEARKRLEKEAA